MNGRRRSGDSTIRDVAERAGVSRMTVSRVINGDTRVRPETRAQVEEAIAALSFAPNAAARALAGAERIRIGLLHRFPNSGYLGEFLVGLLDETASTHVGLRVRKVTQRAEDASAVAELAADKVQGVILSPPLADDPDLLALLRRQRMAVVVAGSARQETRLSSVGIDEGGAAYAMTCHLLALGHRRIGFIKGDPSHASTGLRLRGFRTALEQAGIPADEALIADGRYTYLSGLDAAERLLALQSPPTAVFASNDDMAAATVAVAHRCGIDVPADLSVCGFDDTTLATTIWPELTTIRQPILLAAKMAVQLLLQQIAAGPAHEPEVAHVLLDHVLVRRQSDAAPRARPAASSAAE